MAVARVLELEVTLEEIEPKIWRRFLVSAEATLGELHAVVQDVMGWTNSHLHSFHLPGGRQASDPRFQLSEYGGEWLDEHEVILGSVFKRRGAKLAYEYDFGDSWAHTVKLTNTLEPKDVSTRWPWCIEGARACPPEDAGGSHGYMQLANAIQNGPTTEWQHELLEWAGGYDPDEFSVEEVNRSLCRRCGVRPEGSGADELEVPTVMRGQYEEIVAITDRFCDEHLNVDYSELAREMTATLARQQPLLLRRGRVDVWAAGVLHALGRLNFLSDPTFEPHMNLAEIGPLLGVGKSTSSAKGNTILRTLEVSDCDPAWMCQELLDQSPFARALIDFV